MWKKIICISMLILFISVSASAEKKLTHDHLSELKEKFPYALLGDDYGILTVSDLATNACGRFSEPLDSDSDTSKSYLYWQCFESKTISFDCEEYTSYSQKGLSGLIVITAKKDKEQNDYIEHKPWPIKECKQFIRDAAKLIKGTKYACMAGSFIEKKTSPSGQISKSWMVERIKTRKGCEGRDCKFTKKFQQETCPELKF